MASNDTTFNCYLVTKDGKQVAGRVARCKIEDLPPGEVLIRVAYSSLNYKDALSATGHPGVTQKFPHVPGIDAAGTVVASQSPQWREGEPVIVTGRDLGVNHWGGWAEYIRVPADWIVRLPDGLTQREAMILGTAGFTACQCVAALVEHNISPKSGDVVVTGSSGGVGSVAVAILGKLGYQVAAVSGKESARGLLIKIGARSIIGREEVDDRSGKPLLPVRWAGAVDTAGGNILATLIKSTRQDGIVTACGLVAGTDIPLTVYPFILRGVGLLGIDSALCPMEQRLAMWEKLSGAWKPNDLDAIATEIELEQLPEHIEKILAGRITGRTIVRLGGS